ncbi:putative eukaryotic initiation factor 4a [Trypanosoma grayi]|uniref:putative eukaryotic initiation factor 4a n=1 Tax=Trypanosoma grayi TaxID=71804 RepID=UPI0004F474F2|nr:putative eukaryotic initiation factor 4a [Trypanosoma grayi]KEG11005.1 putative eukaryotic initiation factor 4a [Trypanosoma grayi]
MEPLAAARVKKPRRTSSVPGSETRAACRRGLPRSLVDALHAARERFECYRKTTLNAAGNWRPCEKVSIGTQTVDTDHQQNEEQPQLQVQQQQQQQQKLPAVSNTLVPSTERTLPSSGNPTNSYSPSTEQTPGDGMGSETRMVENEPDAATVAVAATLIPYSPEATPLAMERRRHVTGCCPEKIAAFLEQLRAAVPAMVAEAPPPPPPPAATTKPKGGTSLHHTARSLEALTELWENRREAPIPVVNTLGRKRGLFGEVERKELHQLVISILNRVTNDAEKYREVKNELLRLPIPEANDMMLAKIVEVFFMKAVKEQHFSNSYADLVSALCKVPEGQKLIGDKSQSLEFRLRQQLLHRCQMEFQQLEEKNVEQAERGGEERALQNAEESFKERRDRACGIVQFVGELYLRHIVTEKVIEHIFLTACTGLYGHEGLRVVPPYTPTEMQMDEVITLLGIVSSVFFRSAIGCTMLPGLTAVLQHWSVRHPVPRIRFLLMSVVERLQKTLEERNATIKTAQQHQQQQQLQPPSEEQEQQQQQQQQQQQYPLSDLKRPGATASALRPHSPSSEEGTFASTSGAGRHALPSSAAAAAAAAASGILSRDISPKMKPPVFVGGRRIPAPRSAASRHGSVALSASLNSTASSSGPVAKQLATTESVARYMQNVSLTGRSVEEVVDEIINNFANVIAVVEVWTERCLTVVKAAKDRALYGAFLQSLNNYHKGSLRPELRKVAMGAFANAVRQKLHEDLNIFRYWVEMIYSDATREVLDEDLLNEALHHLLGNDAAAVRAYLCDVSKQTNLRSPQRPPSDEATDFVRYRPLHVVHRYHKQREPGFELRVVNFPDVRQVNLEIEVFCALLTGAPSKEGLFDAVRSSSRLRCPLIAPELLSAVLHAELCSDTTAFLEDNLDLLSLVSDGPERKTREILLVAELYAVLKNAPAEATRPISAGSRVMAKLEGCIVSDETRHRAQKYFEPRDEFAHHYIGAQVLPLQVRHGNNSITASGSGSSSASINNNNNSGVPRPALQRR